MAAIPVTLLTGFLGSGKTTLVGKILNDPRFSDTAVVINEFGEIGLDHVLVEAAPEAIVEMTSGCLCCTVRGDIRQSLVMLLARSERGEIPIFSRLVIETTGLADPVPVIHTLMLDPRLVRRYALAQIVTTVDCTNAATTLDTHEEAQKQIAVADTLVLTKTDLAPADEKLRERLAALNPSAKIIDARAPDFDVRALVLDDARFMPDLKTENVRAWLNAEKLDMHAPDHHDENHHGDHHHHDVNRHADDIRCFVLGFEAPMSRFAFATAMELLAANQGPDLLRVKGIVKLAEHPQQPIVIHAVQHIMHPPVRLEAWPDADTRTRLVFITRGISPEAMQSFFSAWQTL